VTPLCGAATRWCALLGLYQPETAGQAGFSSAGCASDPAGPARPASPTLSDLGPKPAGPPLFCLRVLDLAQHAGLSARPVLLSSSREILSKVLLPASAYFDHMAVCVELGPGVDRCLDLTDRFGSSLRDSPGLAGSIRLDGAAKEPLGTFPAPVYGWEERFSSHRRLEAGGNLTEQARCEYVDAAAEYVRGVLSGMTREERIRWALSQYEEYFEERNSPEFSFEGIEEPGSTLVVAWKATYRAL
jgi:hypothetical protein